VSLPGMSASLTLNLRHHGSKGQSGM
jgi:hypothetical protein